MLSYNTQLKPLRLPEYGRNIQKMVDHCVTIEDRDERTRCAYAIIGAMQNLLGGNSLNNDTRQKLWDHLAIMSDFKLDIDFPVEIVDPNKFADRPAALSLPQRITTPRNYGKYTVELIEKASTMEDGEERDALVLMIANQMKKTMASTFTEGVDDRRIFKDLEELSHGSIRLNPEETKLHDFQVVQNNKNNKKKKK